MNSKTQQELYDLIAQDELEKCYDVLEKIIQSEAPLLYVELVMLRRSQEALHKEQRSGTLSSEDFRVEESKLTKNVIYLIQQLPSDEEVAPAAGNNTAKGKLLHDIPARFPLQRLTKCVIRIADTEAAVLRDYEAGPDTVIEDVPIEKVMAVELIDIEDGENFEIKPLNSTAQKLLSGEASQWVYYVKALTPGEHLLVLRISTVAMIDGVERPKEVLFERSVRVEAEAVPRPENEQRNWQPTNLDVGATAIVSPPSSAEVTGASTKVAPSSSPPISQPSVEAARTTMPPPVAAPTPATTSSSTPWTKITAALLLLVVAGWWTLNNENYLGPTSDDPFSQTGDLATTGRPGESTPPPFEPEKPGYSIREEANVGGMALAGDDNGTSYDFLIIGTYRSLIGETLKIEVIRNDLFLSGDRYDKPQRILFNGTQFITYPSDERYELKMMNDQEVKGLSSAAYPGDVWIRL